MASFWAFSAASLAFFVAFSMASFLAFSAASCWSFRAAASAPALARRMACSRASPTAASAPCSRMLRRACFLALSLALSPTSSRSFLLSASPAASERSFWALSRLSSSSALSAPLRKVFHLRFMAAAALSSFSAFLSLSMPASKASPMFFLPLPSFLGSGILPPNSNSASQARLTASISAPMRMSLPRKPTSRVFWKLMIENASGREKGSPQVTMGIGVAQPTARPSKRTLPATNWIARLEKGHMKR